MNIDQQHARVITEQDAKAAVNIILWFLVGIFLHFIGLLIAYMYNPSPPISNFLEKRRPMLFSTRVYINQKFVIINSLTPS